MVSFPSRYTSSCNSMTSHFIPQSGYTELICLFIFGLSQSSCSSSCRVTLLVSLFTCHMNKERVRKVTVSFILIHVRYFD